MFENVYADNLMKGDLPPKCIFLPSNKILRKLIRMAGSATSVAIEEEPLRKQISVKKTK